MEGEMKTILSLPKLSRVFKTFPVDYPNGILTLSSVEEKHEFLIKELRFVEYRNSKRSIATEIGRRFAVHELITKQPPAFETYEELWEWLDVPEIFHFHKERFKDIAYQAFIRAMLDIDFEEGLPVKFKPGEVAVESSLLPSVQLHRFAADILKNADSINDYEAFSPETVFVTGKDLPPEVSFDSLLVFQLLREPKSFLEILHASFFPPNRTIECIRELLRFEALVQMGGSVEFNFSALSESLERAEAEEENARPVTTKVVEEDEDETFQIEVEGQKGSAQEDYAGDKKLSEVGGKGEEVVKSRSILPKRRAVTDDYLLISLSYLVLFLLLALPWFVWRGLLDVFR